MAALLLLCGALQGIVGILVVISVQVIQPNFQQPCHHDESVIGSMFIDHIYHATPKKVFPESVQ